MENSLIERKLSEPKETLVVNLFAGPGAGKTTCAWEIASRLKKVGLVTEYVPEYAKELVWEGKYALLDGSYNNQNKIYEEQKHRIDRLIGKVDVIVTDSPLLLQNIYMDCKDIDSAAAFEDKVITDHKNEYWWSFNIFIKRGSVFETEGRIHTLAASRRIDDEIKRFLNMYAILFHECSHAEIAEITDQIIKKAHYFEK